MEKHLAILILMAKKYWLMKSEPEEFSIDDLMHKKTELWTGVRNYQARNFMTKDMEIGDQILFYHSSVVPPGVVGLANVSHLASPDPTQFDKKSDYYDPKAKPDKPIWFCVEVRFEKKFPKMFTLDEIRKDKALSKMLVIKKGSRLSIQPVAEKDFMHILNVSLRRNQTTNSGV